jgi:hypothetical protein
MSSFMPTLTLDDNQASRWNTSSNDPVEDIRQAWDTLQTTAYRRPLTHEEVARQMFTHAALRTCRYCHTFQRQAFPCQHCGAPDEQFSTGIQTTGTQLPSRLSPLKPTHM